MDIFSELNYVLILGTSILSFLIGAIWYGPFFGKVWQIGVGLSDEDLQSANMAVTYGTSFVLIAIMNLTLALVLEKLTLFEEVGLAQGLGVGIILGLGLVATSIGINTLYQQKTIKLFCIDAGYQVLYLAIAGVILGVWG